MLSPNLAFILFPEQWLSVNELVFNLNFVQSAALSALNNVGSKKCNNFMFTLPDSTRTDPTRFFMQLPDPDPTCNFSTRHNTNWLSVSGISKIMHCGILYTLYQRLDIHLVLTLLLKPASLVWVKQGSAIFLNTYCLYSVSNLSLVKTIG